jgi:Na+-driven multidrug efflux pump
MDYAVPYLRCRAAGMVPALFALTSFAAYQGLLNTVTPLRVSLTTNLLNLALNPLFIFGLGRGGAATPLSSSSSLPSSWCVVPSFLSNGSGPSGAAAATSVTELALVPCVTS